MYGEVVICYVLLFPAWISLRGPAAQLPFTIALCAAWDRRIVSLTARTSQRQQHHAHTTRMLTLCADLHHLLFHVSQILITSSTPCYSQHSDRCPTTLVYSSTYSIVSFPYYQSQCIYNTVGHVELFHTTEIHLYATAHAHKTNQARDRIHNPNTLTYIHTQLCTQGVHNMVTFGCLVTVTMEREQWSFTIVASDGLAFAQTAAGVLVRPQWHAGSWDMRLGGQ